MSEEDERVRRSAIRLVAEIQSVQQSSQFEVNSFFESLRRELFDSEKTTFSNVDMSRILSRLQNLIMDLLNQIVDRVSVEAVKQIQIILGDLKNVRESELLAEKTTSAVRREVVDYRLNKYIQDLENHIKLLEERESARKKMLKNVLTRDKKYQILALLENEKGLSYTEISKQLSLTRTKVNEYIKELEKSNLVSVDKNKKPYLITLKQTLWL
ncbi:MAG: winged helix-turn-helix domain-containing protein [Candidatus Jordarchaeaceae archaeon]